MICGARLRGRGKGGAFCRRHAVKGRRRCIKHGGDPRKWNHAAFREGGAKPWGEAQWRPLYRMQAIRKSLGLPWYGGRPKTKATFTMADRAISVANEILELLPEPRDVPDSEKGSAELLGEGVRNGLLLTRDTVLLGRDLLARDGEFVNLKFLGAANVTALGLVKLGLKASETGSRNDIIGKLIAAIEAEKAGAK